MSHRDFCSEKGAQQETARWTKRRVGLNLTFVVLVVLGVVAYEMLTEKSAHLTAVDRATGVQRWRDTLPVSGALAMIWRQDGDLGISACGGHDGGESLIVDAATGKVLVDRGWRPADRDPPVVSVWIDPSTIGDPTAVPEFSYDRVNDSLVSAKGWSVSVHVSGYPRHIPILVVGDSVYFIENANGCGPGSGGGD